MLDLERAGCRRQWVATSDGTSPGDGNSRRLEVTAKYTAASTELDLSPCSTARNDGLEAILGGKERDGPWFEVVRRVTSGSAFKWPRRSGWLAG